MQNAILTIPKVDSKFGNLSGLNQDEFKDSLEIFDAKVTRKQMFYTNKNATHTKIKSILPYKFIFVYQPNAEAFGTFSHSKE